jgi:hypothetical protein
MGRRETLDKRTGNKVAADGGVEPDEIDLEESAEGPDDGGEGVDYEGWGEESAGYEGVG